jgi:hypothetical protein
VKKEDHPFKLLDRESPTSFVMDTWKKTYSNRTSYEEAMAEFWATYRMTPLVGPSGVVITNTTLRTPSCSILVTSSVDLFKELKRFGNGQ